MTRSFCQGFHFTNGAEHCVTARQWSINVQVLGDRVHIKFMFIYNNQGIQNTQINIIQVLTSLYKKALSLCHHVVLNSVLCVRKHDVLHSIVANITPCQNKQKRCLTVKVLTAI